MQRGPRWGLRICIPNKLLAMLMLLNCRPHFETKPWIAEHSGSDLFFITPETTCISNIVGRIHSAKSGNTLLSAFSVSLSLEHQQYPRYCVEHITQSSLDYSLFLIQNSKQVCGLLTQYLITFAQNVTFLMRTYLTTFSQIKVPPHSLAHSVFLSVPPFSFQKVFITIECTMYFICPLNTPNSM